MTINDQDDDGRCILLLQTRQIHSSETFYAIHPIRAAPSPQFVKCRSCQPVELGIGAIGRNPRSLHMRMYIDDVYFTCPYMR